MYKVLEKMVNSKVDITNKYAIRRQMEMFGKIKRFRYYTYQWYMKLFEDKDIDITQPPLPEPSANALVDIDFHEVPDDSYRMPSNLKRALKAAQQTMDTSKVQKVQKVQKDRKPKAKRTGATAEQTNAAEDGEPRAKRPRRAKAASAEASIMTMAAAESSAAIAAMSEMSENPAAAPTTVPEADQPMSDVHPTPEQAPSMEQPKEQAGAVPEAVYNPEASAAAPEALKQSEQLEDTTPAHERPAALSASEATSTSATAPTEISPAPPTTTQEAQPKTPTRKAKSKRPRSGSTTPQRTLLSYFTSSPVKRPRQAGISAERVSELQSATIPSDNSVTSPTPAPEALTAASTSTSSEDAPAPQESTTPDGRYKVLPRQPLAIAEIPIEPVSISEIHEGSASTAVENKEAVAPSATPSNVGEATSTSGSDPRSTTEPASPSASGIIRTSRRHNAVYINKSGIVSAKHKKKSPNEMAYVSRRKQVFLALLEERPIYERGLEFRRAFMEKQAVMFPMDVKGPFLLDLKTLWRAAQKVADDGDAAIHEVSCETLSGASSKRILFMRPGMGPDSPEVKSYEAYLQNKTLLHPAMYQLAKPEYIERVETLDERLERLHGEQDNQAGSDDDDQAISKRTRQQLLNATVSNVKRARALDKLHQDGPVVHGNWSIIAVQYGYIPARMVRTGLMHEQLRRIYMAREEPRSDLITSKELLNTLTLAQYLQLVGVSQSSRVLNEYIALPKNLQTPVHDLPLDLKGQIFSEKNKFRKRVRDMLDLLEYFRLIEPVHVTEGGEAIRVVLDTPANLALAYRFHRHADLHQFRLEGQPILRSFDLGDKEELTQYWESVRYICQSFEGDQKQTYREPEDDKERAIIGTLLSRRNWSMNMSYTREQRERLNSYVDTKTGSTPHSNIQFCENLAHDLGVTTEMVRVYFRRMEQAFERKLLRKYKARDIRRLERDQKPLQRRRKRYDNEAAHKMITLDTKEPFKRHTTSSLANQVAKRSRKRLRELETDHDEEPTFQDKDTSLPRICKS